MGWLASAALAGLAFLGHFAIAVWMFNRLHAIGWPVSRVKLLEKLLLAFAAAASLPIIVLVLCWPAIDAAWMSLGYVPLCWLAGALVLPLWLVPKLRERVPAAVVTNDTKVIDVAERLGYLPLAGREAQVLARVPGNEILQLHVQRKALRLPRLPEALRGLTIAHLSDLHMTGRLDRGFYEVVADETNRLVPDLIAITGDILEKECCLDWIGATLGKLQAPLGKYFILGNHEQRLESTGGLLAEMEAAGFSYLGSRCECVDLRGASVLLAGNERPWFGAAPALSPQWNEFRILLSHSPDQLPWARQHGFDLMLAGHNHGGQIRLPYLGALITPSVYGSCYAGGVYHEPPTLLHVSRGLAGLHSIRLNCPPELALLVLEADAEPAIRSRPAR